MYYHLGGQPSGLSHNLDIVWSKGPRFKSRNHILLMEKTKRSKQRMKKDGLYSWEQTKNEERWTLFMGAFRFIIIIKLVPRGVL